MTATMRVFPEWRDDNAATNYPFSDTATLTNDEGDFISTSTLIDAVFYPVGGLQDLYLSQIRVTATTLTFVVGDSGNAERCWAATVLQTVNDDSSADVVIPFRDSSGRVCGQFVTTRRRLTFFQSWSAGTHEFVYEQTAFVARVVHPLPAAGLGGIVLPSGESVTGEVWLLGDDGIVLQAGSTAKIKGTCGSFTTVQTINVNVVGDPLFRRRLCQDPELFQGPQFIEEIIVQVGCDQLRLTPDERGEFKIVVGRNIAEDNILRAEVFPGGLRLGAVGESI